MYSLMLLIPKKKPQHIEVIEVKYQTQVRRSLHHQICTSVIMENTVGSLLSRLSRFVLRPVASFYSITLKLQMPFG